MKFLENMKLGTRLGLGFASVLVLMGMVIVLCITRFNSIGETIDKIVTQDWVKADAAASISAMTRANARRSMELLFAADPSQVDKLHQKIDANKKKVNESLEVLTNLVHSPEGKAILAKLKETRAVYAESFGRVDKLII